MNQVDISSLIDELAPKAGVNPDLYKRVIFQGENSGKKDIDPATTNETSNATGIAQVLPSIWSKLQQQGRIAKDAVITDPRANLQAGLEVMKDGLKKYGGNEAAAVAHYNGGWRQGDAVAAGQQPSSAETRSYLQRTGLSNMDTPTAGSESLDSSGATVDPKTGMPPYAGNTGSSSGTSRSNTTKTASNSFRDGFDPADILNKFRDATAPLRDALGLAAQQSANYLGLAADAKESQGVFAGGATIGKAEEEARSQEQSRSIAESMGVTGPDSVIIQANKQRAEAQHVMDLLKPQIDAEDQVTPWEDPLRWMVNKFTLPNLKTAYNAANQQVSSKMREITDTQQAVKTAQALDPAPTADLIRKIAISTSAQQQAQAMTESMTLRSQARQVLVQDAQTMLALNQTDVNGALQVARMTQEHEIQSATMASHNAQNAKQAKEDADRAAELTLVNFKQDQMGLAHYTDLGWKDLDRARKAELIQNSQTPVALGNNIGDAYLNIVKSNAGQTFAKVNPLGAEFYQKLINSKDFKDEMGVQLTGTGAQHFGKLSDDQQRAVILDKLGERYTASATLKSTQNMNQLGVGNANNPYLIDYSRVTQYPELQSSPIVQSIMAQQKLTPGKTFTDKDIVMEAVGKSAFAMQNNPQDVKKIATDLTDFFNKAPMLQYAKGGAAVSGMPAPKSYALSTTTMGLTNPLPNGKERATQMMNPAEVEHMLMQSAIKFNKQATNDATDEYLGAAARP